MSQATAGLARVLSRCPGAWQQGNLPGGWSVDANAWANTLHQLCLVPEAMRQSLASPSIVLDPPGGLAPLRAMVGPASHGSISSSLLNKGRRTQRASAWSLPGPIEIQAVSVGTVPAPMKPECPAKIFRTSHSGLEEQMKSKRETSDILLEGYEVEYVLAERRLGSRRKSLPNAPFPPGLRVDRRWSEDRREGDTDTEQPNGRQKRLD